MTSETSFTSYHSIGDVARHNARRFKSRTAFRDDQRSISFETIRVHMQAFCLGLQHLGLKAGDRVAFLSKNRIECIEIFLAAEMGIVVIPINWRLTANEISYILGDCEPSVFITERNYADELGDVIDAQPSIRHRFILDDEKKEGWDNYNNLFKDRSEAILNNNQPHLDDPACIVYTSGTTGKPKGAVLSHRALLSSSDRIAHEMLNLDADDVTIVVMPLFHVGGMWFHCFPSFAVGATTIIQSVFRPEQVLAAIIEFKITNIHLAPTMVGDILDRPETAQAAANLKRIFYAASPMPIVTLKKAMQQFPDTDFFQSYGSTEAGPICWLSPADHVNAIGQREHILKSCGRAFGDVSIKLLPTQGDSLDTGDIGEILVHSSGIMSEYWRNPAATFETVQEGWIATGDLGRIDEDSFVYIADRKKNMIISGGENVYPIEVENVLLEIQGVTEAAVIGVPDDRWVERVVACIVCYEAASLTEDFIIRHTKNQLSGYKCPKEILFMDSLPKNAAGKTLKRQLVEDYPFPNKSLSKA